MVSISQVRSVVRVELNAFLKSLLVAVPCLLAAWGVLSLLLHGFAGSFSQDYGLRPMKDQPLHGKQLILFVHGWMNDPSLLKEVTDSLRSIYPDADLLMPEYRSNTFSNADTVRISGELVSLLDDKWRNAPRPYDDVILVGYSMGAMLVRKAYVFGCGEAQDEPGVMSPIPVQPHPWVDKVHRVVLVAGMNRGWSLQTRPADMPWWQFATFQVQKTLARLTGTARYLLSAERGAPFVANMRLQWLQAQTRRREAGLPTPEVVQLLGTQDDLVSTEDSRDARVCLDFCFLAVQHSGHASIMDFRDPNWGKEREKIFLAAVGTPMDLLKQAYWSNQPVSDQDPNVTKVIFLMHGIRDVGDWTHALRDDLLGNYKESGGDPATLRVSTSGYGYFPMLPFLLVQDRQKNVRWFMDEYTEVCALYPNLKEIDYVGHSNGSFILASGLEKYAALRVDQVVLAGSVVPRNYNWDALMREKRVHHVINFRGSSDWVVAIFPAFFETLNRTFGLKLLGCAELGSGGFMGFEGSDEIEIHYVKGDHGCALQKDNFPAIRNFIFHDQNTFDLEKFGVAGPSWVVELEWRLCWLIWLVIAGGLFVIGGVGSRLLAKNTKLTNQWAWLTIYVAFLYCMLYTY